MSQGSFANLTELETKILKEAGNAKEGRMSVEELAERVGCKSETIYKRLNDDNFRQLFMEASKAALAARVPKILDKFVELAEKGEFKHGKLILEIAGAYTEKKDIKADIGNVEGESVFKNDEERRALLMETLNRIPREDTEDD